MKRKKTTFLKLSIVMIGIVVLILCIFLLPWLAESTAKLNPTYAYLKYPFLIGIYITTIPFFIALYQSLKLLDHIATKSAFSEVTVGALTNIKYCAISIIVLYALGLTGLGIINVLHPSIAIIGVTIIFASWTIALFAAVLQELLNNIIEIKSENDLTV